MCKIGRCVVRLQVQGGWQETIYDDAEDFPGRRGGLLLSVGMVGDSE